jgi:hypothetical protein
LGEVEGPRGVTSDDERRRTAIIMQSVFNSAMGFNADPESNCAM